MTRVLMAQWQRYSCAGPACGPNQCEPRTIAARHDLAARHRPGRPGPAHRNSARHDANLGSVWREPDDIWNIAGQPSNQQQHRDVCRHQFAAGNLSGGTSTGIRAPRPARSSTVAASQERPRALARALHGSSGGPAASASSPTGMGSTSPNGRVGIPMGSTELGVGGLSPPPAIQTPNPSAPVSTFGTTTPCRNKAGTPECQRILPSFVLNGHREHRAGRRCDARLSFPPLC